MHQEGTRATYEIFPEQEPTILSSREIVQLGLCVCVLHIMLLMTSSISFFVFLVIIYFRPLYHISDCFPRVFCFCLFVLSFCTALAAHGGSQAKGLIGAVATCLHQSHSYMGSEPHLRPTPQLRATSDP